MNKNDLISQKDERNSCWGSYMSPIPKNLGMARFHLSGDVEGCLVGRTI